MEMEEKAGEMEIRVNNQERYPVRPAKGEPICAEVPGSKSITNRALLIAALCEGTSELKGVLFSEDSRNFLAAMQELGFPVEIDEENHNVKLTGMGGKPPKKEASVYVGSAGTAARFLAAYLGLSMGCYHMTSSDQMKKRPMQELLEALETLGVQISFEEESYHFPFTLSGQGLTKNEVTVDIDKSSQFLSALLISSVLFEEDFRIHIAGSHGMAYVDMTIAMMAQFGVDVIREDEATFCIPGESKYVAREYQIEPDVSAAAYFYAMSPVLGVSAKVKQVHFDCLQGDIAFLRVLEQMGCSLTEEEDGIKIFPPRNQKLSGGTFDFSAFSDQALTMAAISPFAAEPVTITGIGHIRYQECDRLQAICENLTRLGAKVEPAGDAVTIYPSVLHGAEIETYEDHRVAMSFAIPGLVTQGVSVIHPLCCKKTFEHYFDVLEEKVCNS